MRLTKERVGGGYKVTPFFDPQGLPAARIVVAPQGRGGRRPGCNPSLGIPERLQSKLSSTFNARDRSIASAKAPAPSR
jgi:hypothetical protein